MTELTSWQSQLTEYVEYNRTFVKNERIEVERVDVKRREQPRRVRISKGELFEVMSVQRKGTSTYLFNTKKLLPTKHSFRPGQSVECRSYKKSSDTTTKMDVLLKVKGFVRGETDPLFSVEVEFSNMGGLHMFQNAGRKNSYVIPDTSIVDVEIAADTTTFDRMDKALELIGCADSKPLWLVAAVGSRISAEFMARMVSEESVESESIYRLTSNVSFSKHNPSQQRAVVCAMQSKLTLIHGPPGKPNIVLRNHLMFVSLFHQGLERPIQLRLW